MAGRFKGDVRIEGNFTIEPGAHVTGQVLAGIVVVGGELQGNIEFGWDDEKSLKMAAAAGVAVGKS